MGSGAFEYLLSEGQERVRKLYYHTQEEKIESSNVPQGYI